ncbi:hypothetical protein C7B80_16915 [Cyanosarcina cf. burmensis CCALA 770]|nr:hypothetical protein C7B80_16915 [Cyanosarcina cf. burmensis CCALA 770]
MFYHLAKTLRKNFHPLYHLRKNQLLANVIIPFCDISLPWRVYGINWKVQLKLISHLSLITNSRIIEPEIGTLFLAINKVLKPKVFWDVGANIGFYSWLLMSHNSNLEAVLFELDPSNINLLQKTILRAKLKQAYLIGSAVSDRDGEATFATDNLSSAMGTLEVSEQTFVQRHYKSSQDLISVKNVTLDNV